MSCMPERGSSHASITDSMAPSDDSGSERTRATISSRRASPEITQIHRHRARGAIGLPVGPVQELPAMPMVDRGFCCISRLRPGFQVSALLRDLVVGFNYG